MATPDINAICSQILTSDDLIVEEELFQQVLKDKIVTKLLDNKGSKYIKIFSKYKESNIKCVLFNINNKHRSTGYSYFNCYNVLVYK